MRDFHRSPSAERTASICCFEGARESQQQFQILVLIVLRQRDSIAILFVSVNAC